jgi:hypothetical protein
VQLTGMQSDVGDKEDGGRYAPGSTSAPRHPSAGPAYSTPQTATERDTQQARERQRERARERERDRESERESERDKQVGR